MTPENYIEWVRVYFDPLKCHILLIKTVVCITLQVSHQGGQNNRTQTTQFHCPAGAQILEVLRVWTLKIYRKGLEYVFTPKMSHSFIRNCCRWITLRVSHHQERKICQKGTVKLIFLGAYTGCREAGLMRKITEPQIFPVAVSLFGNHCRRV